MSDVSLHTMLIRVDPGRNSNKFYSVTMNSSGLVTTKYGRVGDPGKSGVTGHGDSYFHRVVESKKRKGYTEASVEGVSTYRRPSGVVAKRKATADIAGGSTDPRLTQLIDRIVAVNAHEISTLSGGKLTVSKSGAVSTPLGLLTLHAIAEAESVLTDLEDDPTDKNLLATYLTLVPQNVGRSRGWADNFFSGDRTVYQQRAFLDQLRQAVLFSQAPVESDEDENQERAFAYSLTPVDDASVIDEIKKMFSRSLNGTHPSARMRVVNVYEMSSPASQKAFEEKSKTIGNVRRMWHGTRAQNVLSILATGLQVPRSSARHVTARMFGDGLYFSEQSTKSLNYSRGGVWSSGVDRRCMMFVADVAMGHEYRPNIHGDLGRGSAAWAPVLDGKRTDPKHKKVFTSINVRGGEAGVRNHEAIVPGPAQVALRYLVEFED